MTGHARGSVQLHDGGYTTATTKRPLTFVDAPVLPRRTQTTRRPPGRHGVARRLDDGRRCAATYDDDARTEKRRRADGAVGGRLPPTDV